MVKFYIKVLLQKKAKLEKDLALVEKELVLV